MTRKTAATLEAVLIFLTFAAPLLMGFLFPY